MKCHIGISVGRAITLAAVRAGGGGAGADGLDTGLVDALRRLNLRAAVSRPATHGYFVRLGDVVAYASSSERIFSPDADGDSWPNLAGNLTDGRLTAAVAACIAELRASVEDALGGRPIRPSSVCIAVAGGAPTDLFRAAVAAVREALGAEPALISAAQALAAPILAEPEHAGEVRGGLEVTTEVLLPTGRIAVKGALVGEELVLTDALRSPEALAAHPGGASLAAGAALLGWLAGSLDARPRDGGRPRAALKRPGTDRPIPLAPVAGEEGDHRWSFAAVRRDAGAVPPMARLLLVADGWTAPIDLCSIGSGHAAASTVRMLAAARISGVGDPVRCTFTCGGRPAAWIDVAGWTDPSGQAEATVMPLDALGEPIDRAPRPAEQGWMPDEWPEGVLCLDPDAQIVPPGGAALHRVLIGSKRACSISIPERFRAHLLMDAQETRLSPSLSLWHLRIETDPRTESVEYAWTANVRAAGGRRELLHELRSATIISRAAFGVSARVQLDEPSGLASPGPGFGVRLADRRFIACRPGLVPLGNEEIALRRPVRATLTLGLKAEHAVEVKVRVPSFASVDGAGRCVLEPGAELRLPLRIASPRSPSLLFMGSESIELRIRPRGSCGPAATLTVPFREGGVAPCQAIELVGGRSRWALRTSMNPGEWTVRVRRSGPEETVFEIRSAGGAALRCWLPPAARRDLAGAEAEALVLSQPHELLAAFPGPATAWSGDGLLAPAAPAPMTPFAFDATLSGVLLRARRLSVSLLAGGGRDVETGLFVLLPDSPRLAVEVAWRSPEEGQKCTLRLSAVVRRRPDGQDRPSGPDDLPEATFRANTHVYRPVQITFSHLGASGWESDAAVGRLTLSNAETGEKYDEIPFEVAVAPRTPSFAAAFSLRPDRVGCTVRIENTNPCEALAIRSLTAHLVCSIGGMELMTIRLACAAPPGLSGIAPGSSGQLDLVFPLDVWWRRLLWALGARARLEVQAEGAGSGGQAISARFSTDLPPHSLPARAAAWRRGRTGAPGEAGATT